MTKRTHTNIYVSLHRDDDEFIDNLRIKKIKDEKKHYTKTQIVKELIRLGIDVENGKYLKLDPNIDEFVSKLQTMTIEMNGEKIQIKKNKKQVYEMLINKGLQHLND